MFWFPIARQGIYKGFGKQISVNKSVNNIILNKIKIEAGSNYYKGFK